MSASNKEWCLPNFFYEMITKVTFVMYSRGQGRYSRNSDVVVA